MVPVALGGAIWPSGMAAFAGKADHVPFKRRNLSEFHPNQFFLQINGGDLDADFVAEAIGFAA